MRFRRAFGILLALAHLALVIFGACHGRSLVSQQPIAQPLLWYAQVTGAGSSYSFYAPEVGDLFRARFTLQDSRGRTWEDSFEEAASPEARLRLTGITEASFANGAAEESPERRDRIVRSWSATLFSRHPSAVSLVVAVEAYEIPTMAAFRAGQRPAWKAVYRAQVIRDSSAPGRGETP